LGWSPDSRSYFRDRPLSQGDTYTDMGRSIRLRVGSLRASLATIDSILEAKGRSRWTPDQVKKMVRRDVAGSREDIEAMLPASQRTSTLRKVTAERVKADNPLAYKQLEDEVGRRPEDAGDIYAYAQYYVYQPRSSGTIPLIWAAKQPKVIVAKDIEKAMDKEERDKLRKDIGGRALGSRGAKSAMQQMTTEPTPSRVEKKGAPTAWITWRELTMDQRRQLPWMDPRTRGKAEVPASREMALDPMKDVWYNPYTGEVEEERPEEGQYPTVGGVRSASGPGGEPTHGARAAASRMGAKEPNWNRLTMGGLKRALKMAYDGYKSSPNPESEAVIKRILSAMDAKRTAAGAQAAQGPKKEPVSPRFEKSVEQQFGPRKKWGKTSPNVDIRSVQRVPKKKEDE